MIDITIRMKRLLAMIFVLVFVFSCGGCKGDESNGSATVEDSLILVRSGDALTKPYENFLWAETWSEPGWLSVDGTSLSRQWAAVQQEIPQITYGEGFEILYRDEVTFVSVSVYTNDFESVYHNEVESVLAELAEGEYYLVITVKKQGDYVEVEDKYEYSGYECAYHMKVE